MKKRNIIHLIAFVVALFAGLIVFNYYGDPTSSATVTLAIVTIYYAWQTRVMVEELRKDRYIAFLDKRLEELYTPLLNLKAELVLVLEKISQEFLEGNIRVTTVKKLEELNKNLSKLRKFTHLASNDLQKDLEKFLNDYSIFVSSLSKIIATINPNQVIIPKEIIEHLNMEIFEYSLNFNEEVKNLKNNLKRILKIAEKEAEKYRNRLIKLRDW